MVTEDAYDNQLPYDLRQIYAVNIVGEHLKDIAIARKMDDYSAYYKGLKDLWVITQHKIKEKEKNAPETYRELINNAVKTINQYPQTYNKKIKDPAGKAYIEQALNEIEMFLYDKMYQAKMFGAKQEVEGLM